MISLLMLLKNDRLVSLTPIQVQMIEWKRLNAALLWHETFFCRFFLNLCIFSLINSLFLWKLVALQNKNMKGN